MTNVKKLYIPINGQSVLLCSNREGTHTNIYGAEWDGTESSKWVRTDDAQYFNDPDPAVNNGTGYSPFDSIYPWAGMRRVTDSTAGELVEIPKYYYKWTYSGTKMKLQISPLPFTGAKVSPAHADRGDGAGVREKVYVGRYHCANTYKSVTGYAPTASKTRAEFRTGIHNLGSKIWQNDFAMFWTIRMLYLVEFADWNCQPKIGKGCGNSSSLDNNGLTDSMQYHTGTTAASRTTNSHVQYRYIEDLWSNAIDWCDGIYFSGANVYVINKPASFSDTTGGTKVGTRATTSGYITSFSHPTTSGFEYALYPNGTGGSYSTYVCDWNAYGENGTTLASGGHYSADSSYIYGLFYTYGNTTESSKASYYSSRLMMLP